MTINLHGKSFGHEPYPDAPLIHNVFDDCVSYVTEIYHRIRLISGNPSVPDELKEKARRWKAMDSGKCHPSEIMSKKEEEEFLDELFKLDLDALRHGWLAPKLLSLEEEHQRDVKFDIMEEKNE